MFSQKTLDNMSVSELASRVNDYAGYVESHIDNPELAYDYMNSLGLLVQELQSRLYDVVIDE